MRIIFCLLPDLCDFESCNLQISGKTIDSGAKSSLLPLVCSSLCGVLFVSGLNVLLGGHVIP